MINSAQLSNKIFRLSSFSFPDPDQPVQLSLYNTRIETVNETEVIIKGLMDAIAPEESLKRVHPNPEGAFSRALE